MKFSVIASVDMALTDENSRWQLEHLSALSPRKNAALGGYKLWTRTEDDEQYDYEYLADEGAESWRTGLHRKYVGMVSELFWRRFYEAWGLRFNTSATMGSLGSPANPCGVAPAISYSGGDFDEGVIIDVYVTPLPDKKTDAGYPGETEDEWNKVCEYMEEEYS